MSNGKKLVRKTDDRMIAGVASGLAEYLGIDVTLVRVVLVVTAVFGGFGLVLYLVMWILVPEDVSGQALLDVMPEPADEPADAGEGDD